MSSKTLDVYITDSIRASVQRSQPRFNHYLQKHGLACRIKEASPEELQRFWHTGEVALLSCLSQYTHQRWTPETRSGYHGTIKTRVLCPETYGAILTYARSKGCNLGNTACSTDTLHLFVGVLQTTLGLSSTFDWFLATFGPILDDVSVAYDTYHIVSESTSCSKKRCSSDGEVLGAKRVKTTHSHFHRSKAILLELESTLSSPIPLSSAVQATSVPKATVNTPRLLDTLDISSLFRPAVDTVISTPLLSLPAATTPLTSLSYFSTIAQEHAHELTAGVSAFTQREVEAFNRAARGKTIFSIPMAFYEGFVSALSANADSLASTTSTPVHSSPPSAPERRFPLPYRRSRAPSPPSPRPLKTSYISNTVVSSQHKTAPTFTTFQIPCSLKTWYPKLAMQSAPVRKRHQTPAGPSSIPPRTFTSSFGSAVPPTSTTLGLGRHRNLYHQQRDFF
ncbi:hypothetical protein FB451DRAFT_1283814 [Mycena latifolia]|nr:hypothetical protein FB451DRAFT_1283814 [Mycena latifolia]